MKTPTALKSHEGFDHSDSLINFFKNEQLSDTKEELKEVNKKLNEREKNRWLEKGFMEERWTGVARSSRESQLNDLKKDKDNLQRRKRSCRIRLTP